METENELGAVLVVACDLEAAAGALCEQLAEFEAEAFASFSAGL